MTRLLSVLLCLLVSVSVSVAYGDDEPERIWIYGQLVDEARQKEYLEFVNQIFGYYQEQGAMPGRLVAQEDLESVPEDHIVIIGPVQAFKNIQQYNLPLEVSGENEVTIGGRVLKDDRTGIFLASEGQTRHIYTGLSLDGFRDIFTVPTGDKACTITWGRGEVLLEGEWGAQGLVLKESLFLDPYPTQEELSNLVLPEGALTVEPVTSDSQCTTLDASFAKWLKNFVQGQRVFFFGESHWNSGVNRFFNLIVENLLETGEVRAVFCEVNYSFSGFFNYFVTEPDEGRAREFLQKRLHPLVSSSSTLDLLELLRAWNLVHPDEPVRIGCLDMEWGTSNVARNIIQPYFRQLDSDYTLQLEDENVRERLQELLAEAREKDIVGKYPFITPQYMETVVANLWDTVDIQDFNTDRQRGIIRNMTEFNGELFKEGLVLFKGGGWHAVKQKVDGETFHREAAYLNDIYSPTKGKVVTLYAQGLGFHFGEIAELNLSQRMSSATKYNNLLRNYQKALADGRIGRDGYYLLESGGLNIFDRLVAKTGYLWEQDFLRIVAVDWEKLTGAYGQSVLQNRVRDYDAVVYILRSGIEVMRPSVFETH